MTTNEPILHLGTSSWSCSDWVGHLYEVGTAPRDFIASYARKLTAVEIDATFYAIPRKSTIENWRDHTPVGFIFAAKAPGLITHEKFLKGCDKDLGDFLDTMSILGPRLGPILFQFPYYAKASGVTEDDLLTRLGAFVPALPTGYQWAVEIRNKSWIKRPLLDLLAEFKVVLALIDHPWMDCPDNVFAKEGVLTGPFAYIRWLGDRYGIEKITTTWDTTVIDRRVALQSWVPHIKRLVEQRIPVFGFANNHYAGYAPGTLELLKQLLTEAE